MKLFSFAALVFCVALTRVESADPPPPPPGGPPKCNGEEIKVSDALTQTFNTSMQTCMSKFKSNSPDGKGPEDRLCFILCNVQGIGMVDAAGKIVISKVTEIANAMFSTTSATAIVSAISKCASEKGSNVVIKEGDCSSFSELDKCVTTAFHDICKMK